MDNSKIEWTTHTFNPWWGCMKVSEGCKHCYAETLDKRWKGGHWGPGSTRRAMSEAYWKQPLKWDKAAAAAGVKAKVFCASMADVFEETDMIGSPDNHSIILAARIRLFRMIFETPNLIWQLLTKRPHNILNVLREVANHLPHLGIVKWLEGHPPANVWIGTSVENQAAADERIPHLLKVPAAVRFLSCEPLLGPVELTTIKNHPGQNDSLLNALHGMSFSVDTGFNAERKIDWVIAGGESGHHARPMHPDWLRGLRDQCKAADVPFFFKQHGEWCPGEKGSLYNAKVIDFTDGQTMVKCGKKAAGRLLDDVEHSEFPKH